MSRGRSSAMSRSKEEGDDVPSSPRSRDVHATPEVRAVLENGRDLRRVDECCRKVEQGSWSWRVSLGASVGMRGAFVDQPSKMADGESQAER